MDDSQNREPEAAAKVKRILVIDDDETVLKLYARLLKEEGHRVVEARNGREALERVQGGYFDLVFLDLKLPDMHGNELLKKLKERIDWVPVIIVTANPSLESSIDAIRTGGVYEYVVKPFAPDELRRILRRALDKAELTAENRRLLRKLQVANKALTERVEELERFAYVARDHERTIKVLQERISQLEGKD